MVITILTLFPQIFKPVFNSSIIKKAKSGKKITINLVNIRDFAADKHHSVDDRPYGGGVGMLLRIDILHQALESVKIKNDKTDLREKVVLLDPTGRIFNQSVARRFTGLDHLILICGHYEGFDSRIDNFIDEKISVGKFILTGGELPAAIITDAVVRLLPGVLKNPAASREESFSPGLNREAPQYTRPPQYLGYKVPAVLLGGNHPEIEKWKKKNSNGH